MNSQKIYTISEKKLIGRKINMSFSENKTTDLWKSFMPEHKKIKNRVGEEFFSVEIYNPAFFDDFSSKNEFEKWACVEVSDFDNIPDGMESLVIPEGLYGVFLHKGYAKNGEKTYNYIFNEWLPKSGYKLDNRPHMAVMGEKYQNNSPNSEENIYVPILKL